MKKRPTKEAREAAEKAALRQRLEDMLWGAFGDYERPDISPDECPSLATLGLDAFGRWLGAITRTFGPKNDWHVTAPRSMENFDSLDKATDWLHRNGVRANG